MEGQAHLEKLGKNLKETILREWKSSEPPSEDLNSKAKEILQEMVNHIEGLWEGSRGLEPDLGEALQDWDLQNLQDEAEAQAQVEQVWGEV